MKEVWQIKAGNGSRMQSSEGDDCKTQVLNGKHGKWGVCSWSWVLNNRWVENHFSDKWSKVVR